MGVGELDAPAGPSRPAPSSALVLGLSVPVGRHTLQMSGRPQGDAPGRGGHVKGEAPSGSQSSCTQVCAGVDRHHFGGCSGTHVSACLPGSWSWGPHVSVLTPQPCARPGCQLPSEAEAVNGHEPSAPPPRPHPQRTPATATHRGFRLPEGPPLSVWPPGCPSVCRASRTQAGPSLPFYGGETEAVAEP